ncbi:MAG TPA: cytochrome b/b6 domain-containing protein [Bacteroidales bacterium]|nr:cytochrome b/b6 domain-containing protein [Bacteroidales bacterium]HPI68482.1 cytochrome b/b6 domain-containing protein [Bacteroidales bacterium]
MYLYPLWIRLWHVVNALSVIVLILTGITMLFGDDTLSPIAGKQSAVVRWHNIPAVILTLGYVIFVTGNIITDNGKHYRIKTMKDISGTGEMMKYYLSGMFRGRKNPFKISFEQKFNPLQKIIYFKIMYVVMPLLILSGIVLMLSEERVQAVFGINGQLITDIVHIIMGSIVTVFLIIHICMSTICSGGKAHMRAVITGFRTTDED